MIECHKDNPRLVDFEVITHLSVPRVYALRSATKFPVPLRHDASHHAINDRDHVMPPPLKLSYLPERMASQGRSSRCGRCDCQWFPCAGCKMCGCLMCVAVWCGVRCTNVRLVLMWDLRCLCVNTWLDIMVQWCTCVAMW